MTLVFIHGAGFTGEIFAEQLRAFGGSHAPNLPGHAAPGSAATVREFADFIADYVRERRLEHVVLCGHSMGGAVALQVALDALVPVEKIVLLGSGARLRVAPAFLEGLAEAFEPTARGICELLYADPSIEQVERALDFMRRVGPAQTLADFRACDAFDALERLAEVSVPLLALSGAADKMTPPKFAQALADRVARGQARIVSGAGHLVMVERPEETNEAIRAFVQ